MPCGGYDDVQLYDKLYKMYHCIIVYHCISLPKGARADLSNSDMYRSIAISSLLSKFFDNVVIERQQDFLSTSSYQFGFKAKSSTVLCTTMVKETIQYYIENGSQAVYLLLLDASKAFDKVSYEELFELL